MRKLLLAISIVFAVTLGWGYRNAATPPVVRRASVEVSGWPAGAASMRLLLLADLHVAGPDMSPAKLARLVAGLNMLRPDLVLIAGDLVSDVKLSTIKYPADEAIAPLRGLRSRFGVVAVLGNHDHWRDAGGVSRALAANGVTLLDNNAVRRGALTVAGVDDAFTGHADVSTALSAAAKLGGPAILLSHSPDVSPAVPASIVLTLAGHTHCGQIKLPLIGRLATASRYGERYACGLIRENGRTLIVSASIGTSVLPLRYGAPPDVWLVTLKPPQ